MLDQIQVDMIHALKYLDLSVAKSTIVVANDDNSAAEYGLKYELDLDVCRQKTVHSHKCSCFVEAVIHCEIYGLRQYKNNFLFQLEEEISFSILKSNRKEHLIEHYLDTCRKFKMLEDGRFEGRPLRFLMNMLYEHCDNSFLVLKFLQTVHVNIFLWMTPLHFPNIHKFLDYALKHVKRMKYDFSLKAANGTTLYAVDSCLIKARYESMEVLIKHGMSYSFSPYVYFMAPPDFFYDRIFDDWHIFKLGAIDILRELTYSTRFNLILLVFRIFHNEYFANHCGKSIACLSLAYRTIPDPYVTHEEMYEALKPTIKSEAEDILLQICDEYKNSTVCEGDLSQLAPRTLLHLCRCCVRNALAKNYNLPEGIDLLDQPLKLRSYLRLEY